MEVLVLGKPFLDLGDICRCGILAGIFQTFI